MYLRKSLCISGYQVIDWMIAVYDAESWYRATMHERARSGPSALSLHAVL